MERLVVFYAVLAQDSPRLCADCAGAWSGWGVCGTAEAVPFYGALGVRFLVRVSSKAFGAGFVISHPFAKCAKGWGTRRLGGAGMSKASPRSSRIRADWTKPYSSPRRGVTEKINGKCGDRPDCPNSGLGGQGWNDWWFSTQVLAQGSPRWGGACAWALVGVGGLRHG
jgi:hypothetical protein